MSGFAPPRKHPVIEIFGPVVQGEGILAGAPTHFIRFGGCDYRCSWCDSMYAVEPEQVRANAEKLTSAEIIAKIEELDRGPDWITLSGGNPALLDLSDVVQDLQYKGYKVAVETQGSRWRDWLAKVDCLTVSPKPPSSGMGKKVDVDLLRFMDKYPEPRFADCMKIVVFDDTDYAWARKIFATFPDWPAFLSVGTDPIAEWGDEVVKAESIRETLFKVGARYAWLCEKASKDEAMSHVRLLPQLHVIAFGHSRGV